MIQPTTVLSASNASASLKPALVVLFLILTVMVISSVAFSIIYARTKKGGKLILGVLYAVTLVTLICSLLCFNKYNTLKKDDSPVTSGSTAQSTSGNTTNTTTSTTEETIVPDPTYDPAYVDKSNPQNWNIKWDIIQNGSVVDRFNRTEPISFGNAEEYTNLEGVVSFRGDNYRSGATYGTANVVNETLSTLWSSNLTSFNTWSGAGWTGQPLIVRWDAETKSIMNLYDSKKAKEDLVEVIYATLDGHVRFFDLDDGSQTRDPIYMGMNFKSSGSLDPRGYPILYVGSGDFVPSMATSSGKAPRMFAVSLINGTILDQKSGSDAFALRGWTAFDSAPLVDAETDTLIWPAENGIIYTLALNTQYDKAAGTISVKFNEVAKTRYTTKLNTTLGFESSAIIVGKYLYVGDNGGMFFCVDLTTMDLVWAQEIRDDMNATPVFEWGEDGNGYLYLATSLEFSKGTSYIYKLNACTGEVVWEKTYDGIPYNKDVSGGALSSPLLGKKGTNLEGMILFSIARTPSYDGGILVALDTKTGDVIWENNMDNYTWSSPAAVYTESGKGYVVICDSVGNVSLINGETGNTLSKVNIGSNVEASPAIFENIIVVGTRGQKVYGLKVE